MTSFNTLFALKRDCVDDQDDRQWIVCRILHVDDLSKLERSEETTTLAHLL